MTPIRQTILDLKLNGIAQVAYMALGEQNLIPLWFGETDLVTPSFIRDAAKQALDEGKTFYAAGRGLLALREAIRAFHRRTKDADIAIERITVPGAAMLCIVTALQCVIEKGDNIVVISPVWPFIFQAGEIAGAETRFVRLKANWHAEQPHWKLDLDELFSACNAKTKAIFISTPGNPTGWMMSRGEQKQVLEFCRAKGVAIISDEVYGTLVFDGSRHAPSFLEIAQPDDPVFVINSFSKPWAMTGWRIGWLVHPAELDVPMHTISVANNTGPTTFAQYGALAALSPEGDAFRNQMLERCRNGRTVVEKMLARQNRVRWVPPEGAFYGFLHIDGLNDSLAFAQNLVKTARVGVAPGVAFGTEEDKDNDAFIRICFAQDPKLLEEGLARIEKAIAAT